MALTMKSGCSRASVRLGWLYPDKQKTNNIHDVCFYPKLVLPNVTNVCTVFPVLQASLLAYEEYHIYVRFHGIKKGNVSEWLNFMP